MNLVGIHEAITSHSSAPPRSNHLLAFSPLPHSHRVHITHRWSCWLLSLPRTAKSVPGDTMATHSRRSQPTDTDWAACGSLVRNVSQSVKRKISEQVLTDHKSVLIRRRRLSTRLGYPASAGCTMSLLWEKLISIYVGNPTTAE